MKKLLVICGPTSTGKTPLAVSLAKKLNGEIISADSRQVYRGMDIGTGKDLPKGAKIKYPWFSKVGYYLIDGIRVWGYDLADPRREFSVAQYLKFAGRTITNIQKSGKLPILVGGTGFYIKGVIDGIPTASVPKNSQLRKGLETKSAAELYDILGSLDTIKAASMNSSDSKNPRRLIRAIEVSQYLLDHRNMISRHAEIKHTRILFIGLVAPKDFLEKKIDLRIKDRIGRGIKKEIEKLIKAKVDWSTQAMMSLGYRQWRDYFEGDVSEENILDEWAREEKKYARRQITWFKKDKRVIWFDITAKNYPASVEKMVKKWYKGDVLGH